MTCVVGNAVPERAHPGELSWFNRTRPELPGCYRIPWGYSLRLVQGLSPKSLNNIFLSTLPFCLEIEKSLLREPLSELSSALAVMSGTFLGRTRQRVLDGVFSIPESSGHRSSRT